MGGMNATIPKGNLGSWSSGIAPDMTEIGPKTRRVPGEMGPRVIRANSHCAVRAESRRGVAVSR